MLVLFLFLRTGGLPSWSFKSAQKMRNGQVVTLDDMTGSECDTDFTTIERSGHSSETT